MTKGRTNPRHVSGTSDASNTQSRLIETGFSETAHLNNVASCECLLKRKEEPADSAYDSGDMLPKGSSALSPVFGHCDPIITPVDIQPCVAVNCESIAKAASTSVS
jgi:hypothetical protein